MPAAAVSHRHPYSRTPLARQLWRAVGQDHSPLCRPVDRARSRLLLTIMVTLALCVAFSTLLALTRMDGMVAQAHRTAQHRHQVTATTLATVGGDDPASTATSAKAAWDYPQSDHRTGFVPVPAGTAPGVRVPLWVDDSGNPAAPPLPDGRLETTAGMDGLVVLAVTGAAVWTGYAVRRRVLDRRAECGWEHGWEQVEPLWSGRGRRPENGEC
ncbi:hypothetical protein OG455_04510 [Kitasatospora sp. NBC_01287]|uniref:Rv1733c family protein n=1 Tax=Kitasatospora sp. NBC_01287 TaxID=2903573 RepID=UPI002259BF54|nr:hypothetical protein [Kitasatospora sp. NBC_01287]MCX4744789.1 hypothetical protein [Kitasatospora sp. NBC_01287]